MTQKLSFTEQIVLAILEDNHQKTLNTNRVFSRIPADANIDKDAVYHALLSLVQKKKIKQPSKGNFQFQSPDKIVKGILEFARSGDVFLIPDEEELENDIFISPKSVNKGLPGDRVEVLVATHKGKKYGLVYKILERSKRPILGILDVYNGKARLLVKKEVFPFDIQILDQVPEDKDNCKASVVIVDFDTNRNLPTGKIVEILGLPGENDTEMHAIVAEFGFRTQFSEPVLQEAEIRAQQNAPLENEKRRDFRKTLTFTIDPADAKDFDDAISFKRLTDNQFEIGVHIADVSHFVVENSILDKEALLRGTSVYLADRTIPMLPEVLSNDVCSLKPNEDRLAFSAVFVLNMDGEIISEWFGKTLIHSQRRYSYEEAQHCIETGTGDYFSELQLINGIAKKLNATRMQKGAMGFETAEIKFVLDKSGKPIKVVKKVRFDAHKLIEEFMLLANKRVAQFVKLKQKPELPFIYRLHDTPSQEKVMDLIKFAQLFGYKIDASTPDKLRFSIAKLIEDSTGKPESHILQSTAIRSMAKAVYTAKRSDHYGLAFEYYTHFTSPIRRYPDLLAHRLLQRYLLGQNGNFTMEQIEAIAKLNSNAEQKAADAERASTKYKMAEFLQDKKGQVYEAIVTGITDWGIYAEIIENYCEGLIRFSEIRWDRFVYLEKERKAIGKKTGTVFQLGDVISIRVKNANPIARLIDFGLEY